MNHPNGNNENELTAAEAWAEMRAYQEDQAEKLARLEVEQHLKSERRKGMLAEIMLALDAGKKDIGKYALDLLPEECPNCGRHGEILSVEEYVECTSLGYMPIVAVCGHCEHTLTIVDARVEYTFAATPDQYGSIQGWSYQTGDTSYTGGCYGHAEWLGPYCVSLDTDIPALAREVLGDMGSACREGVEEAFCN